jgi:hypothetical protein
MREIAHTVNSLITSLHIRHIYTKNFIHLMVEGMSSTLLEELFLS